MNEDALSSYLRVKIKISPNLDFVCVKDDFKDEKRIVKAKEVGAIIISENLFFQIFKKREYNIYKNEIIFPKTIADELRIVLPLNNFNETINISSFSLDNEKTYLINLFEQTCNCNEFIENNKSRFEKGDLRRFCKHLVSEYNQSFAPRKLSNFKRFLIEGEYSLKSNFKKLNIDKIDLPIYFSYDNNNEWCDIYFPLKNIYKRYSYNHVEERFSYDDKPHGFVPALRAELNKVFGIKKETNKINKKVISNKNKGCASVLLMFFLVFISIIFFSFIN
jgi:hypothetical protein